MQIERVGKIFQPIKLTIESQAELEWLYALSETSVAQARKNAEALGFTLNKGVSDCQMSLYEALKGVFNDQ